MEFKLRQKSGVSVESLLNKEHSKLVRANRRYLKAVTKFLRLTGSQMIVQRGHWEGESSSNRGNFLETLHLIADYDGIVRTKLSGPRNAKYTQPSIQNEILGIMAKTVRVKIKEDIDTAGYFSIQVDERKDV